MHDHDVSRLPVVRAGLLVGIIARTDIVRAIVAEPRSPEEARERVTVRATRAEVDLGAIAPQRAAAAPASSRPAEVCAVVKADGYGHGAVAVARAGARRRRHLAGGRAASRRAPTLRDGRHRRARSSCSPSRRPPRPPPRSRARPRRRPSTRAAGIDALADGRRGRRRGPARRPPQGRHRDAPGRVPPRRRVAARPGRSRPTAELRLAAVWTHSRSPTSPATPTPTSSSTASTPTCADARGGRHRRAAAPRGQLGRRHRPSRQPASTWSGAASPSTASRRRRRSPAASTCSRAARSWPAVSLREASSRPATALATACATAAERDASVATVPLGYADGVPPRPVGGRRRGAHRRPAPADRGHRDDGPADGRLRRRRRSRSATRSC